MSIDDSFKKVSANISRRKFIGSSAAFIGGALINPLSVGASAYAGGSDTLKLALIGSGSRGTGAAVNALKADKAVELVSLADVFKDRVERSYENLMKIEDVKDRVKVPEENKFTGLDAYKHAIETADVVILATPPAFRPLHFETAVDAGKHAFLEKPVATDAPGTRRIIESGNKASDKGLSVIVGLQNRYALRYKKLIEQIDSGAIGDITSMNCNYMIGGIRHVEREEDQTELEYQLRNWRYFEWLWGGSPAALTIHFEDIAHWAKGSHPVRAFGTGGRAAIEGPEYGNIYDHYYIEYEYEDGSHLHSRTRHIDGAWVDRSSLFQGSKGSAHAPAWGNTEIKNLDKETTWNYRPMDDPDPFQTEHELLFEAIRSGNPVNNTEQAAYSNMASIMGRMAVHSGQRVEWDDAYNSDLVLVPDDLSFDSEPPVTPGEDGNYPVPVPGSKTNVY